MGQLAVTFATGLLSALFAFMPPGVCLADPRQVSSSPPQIPADCKAPEETAGSAVASQESYDALGTLYGRAGNFRCAVAAFEAALSLNPQATQTRYNLGLALLENHEAKRAADELRIVIHQDPNSFAAYNALGLALQDWGDSEEAAKLFETALRINPHFALAFFDLAQLRSSQKKYRAAVYYLEQGLASSPSSELAVEMKLALGVVHAQQGDYKAAIPLFQQVIGSRPDSAELHFDLATAYAHLDDYPHAAREYKLVLQLDSNNSQAKLSLAKALMNLSAVEEALAYLKEYVRLNPKDAEGETILGEALKDSGHLGPAQEALHQAVRLNPGNYKAHYELGVVLARSGGDNEAIKELQTAVKLKPDGAEARYQLGLILERKKDGRAAKEQIEAFEQLKQGTTRQSLATPWSNRANELLKQGNAKGAVEAYQKALELEPNDAKLHFNLAIALSRLKDGMGQERELKKAIELDPGFSEAHNQRGSFLMLQGNLAEAEREFRSAIENNPQYAEALNNLGTVRGHQGKNDEAAALFREAATDDPQYIQAYVNLGLTLAAEGKYPEAEQQFQRALSFEPNDGNALTGLGMLLGKTGRNPESVKTFKKLVDLYPKSSDARINLGIALGDANDLQGALQQFSEGIQLAPDSALGHFNRGRVLYALNRRDEAKRELAEAVRLSPNYTAALFLLGVLEHNSPYATQLFQKVVELQPKNAEARSLLARNLLQEGKKDEAIAQWKLAVESDPESLPALSSLVKALAQTHNPEANDYLARLSALEQRQQITARVQQLNNFALQAANGNNWAQAIAQLKEAIDLCGQCAQIGVLRKNIGLLYARKGDFEDAKEQLQIALKLLPDGPDAASIAETLARLSPQLSTPR
jgi:tetratricopeptide (TPR) repeat protein